MKLDAKRPIYKKENVPIVTINFRFAEYIKLIQDLNPNLVLCTVCKNKTMRITPKKKIKFCFYCGKDIK